MQTTPVRFNWCLDQVSLSRMSIRIRTTEFRWLHIVVKFPRYEREVYLFTADRLDGSHGPSKLQGCPIKTTIVLSADDSLSNR